MKTGCADYHATTKKFLMEQIDDDLKKIKTSKTNLSKNIFTLIVEERRSNHSFI